MSDTVVNTVADWAAREGVGRGRRAMDIRGGEGEKEGERGGRTCTLLDPVAMVDATFGGLGIDIDVLELVVEVHAAGTHVAAQERGVGREDGRHRQAPVTRHQQSHCCLPLGSSYG